MAEDVVMGTTLTMVSYAEFISDHFFPKNVSSAVHQTNENTLV